MAFTRKSIADHLDSYDDEISELQESKREMLADYRQQLADSGMGKAAIKSEIDALKIAMRRRRAIAKKGEEQVEEADALADEIFVEITSSARRATRVASAVPNEVTAPKASNSKASSAETVDLGTTPHDPETGEITEQEQPETAHQSPAPTHKTAGSAPRDEGSEGANIGGNDVDRGTERAGHADQPFDALTGQVESRNSDVEFVERNTSGPDDKRAPHSPSGAATSDAVADTQAPRPSATAAIHRPLNPDCRKASRGEQCALMHSQALCSKCQQAKSEGRVAA